MTTRPVHGGNLAWAARLASCSPDDILDFSASISPLGPPASVLDAIQGNLMRLVRYPDPSYRQLCEVIANYHHLSPDWVLPGNGAAELLTWAGREFSLGAGCYAIAPGFADYARALASFGQTLTPLPVALSPVPDSPQQLTARLVAAVRSAIAAPDWGLLLNNPHNPSGGLLPVEAMLPELARFSLVVVDEAFMDFLPPAQQQSLIDRVEQCPNLVILRSLTKAYSIPGLRLGYAIAHPDRLRRWQQWRDPWPVNALAAAAAAAALQDIAFQQQTWDWLAVATPRLFRQLSQIPELQPLPGCANFLLVACDRAVPDLQRALLRRHRLYIRDCLSFPALGDRYFRVAVRTAADNQRLVTALATQLGEHSDQSA
ncbi:MAG: threonine-phosphate decarboxylase [Leptolyngbya sp. SIO4C1]|nr:threonine-phosphate decarboxylase [Leptolyngbya sp. SIO4C1]